MSAECATETPIARIRPSQRYRFGKPISMGFCPPTSIAPMRAIPSKLIEPSPPVGMSGMAFQFRPEDSSFNRTNALYLAHASDVAYHRAPSAAAMQRLGLEVMAFRNKLTRTRGFLGVCDTHAVLA